MCYPGLVTQFLFKQRSLVPGLKESSELLDQPFSFIRVLPESFQLSNFIFNLYFLDFTLVESEIETRLKKNCMLRKFTLFCPLVADS